MSAVDQSLIYACSLDVKSNILFFEDSQLQLATLSKMIWDMVQCFKIERVRQLECKTAVLYLVQATVSAAGRQHPSRLKRAVSPCTACPLFHTRSNL